MANFVEFECYPGNKLYINTDTISFISIEEKESIEKSKYWYLSIDSKNDCTKGFSFKTQAEAQDLYDKLMGKKVEDLPISEKDNITKEIIKIVERTIIHQQNLKYEEWVYNQANGFCDISRIIQNHAYKSPIAENATTSKTETVESKCHNCNKKIKKTDGFLDNICEDCCKYSWIQLFQEELKSSRQKLDQIREVVNSLYNTYNYSSRMCKADNLDTCERKLEFHIENIDKIKLILEEEE